MLCYNLLQIYNKNNITIITIQEQKQKTKIMKLNQICFVLKQKKFYKRK